MLDPVYLDHVSDDMIELYTELDQAIVRDIVRRLVKTGGHYGYRPLADPPGAGQRLVV